MSDHAATPNEGVKFSTYEHDAAREILEHRSKATWSSSRAAEAVGRIAKRVGRRARSLPGADQVLDLAGTAYRAAAEGIAKALTTSAAFTLSERRLWARYKRAGHALSTWADIRQLDLSNIDAVRPRSLRHLYAVSAGAEGAASGLVISGGTLLAAVGVVAGGGAAAAPGAGVAAGVFAADTATTLVASTRLILHVGSYYGYNPRDEVEQLFAAAVLNMGTAATATAKNAAFVDLFRLTNLLARSKAWIELNKAALTGLLQPLFKALSLRLTKMKLGQILPVAGIAVGFGMNYRMLEQVGMTAHWAYRERFLRDKGYPFPIEQTPTDDDDDSGSDDIEGEVISVVQLAEDEGIDLPE